MKNTLLAAFLLFAQPLCAEDRVLPAILSCGKDTVVVYHGSESPDKRYALGWTIQPVAKDAEPVNWDRVEKEGRDYYKSNRFHFQDAGDNPTHKIIIGLIDQRSKSFKFISDTSLPEYWDSIEARWIDEQHVLAQNKGKWGTANLFFLRATSDSFKVTHPLSEMRMRVRELLSQKRPLAPSHMFVNFDFSEEASGKSSDTTVPKTVPCKVENGILHLYFSAYIQRGVEFEDLKGHVLISLKDDKPIKAVSDEPADQPFVGELGEADQRLNEIYAKLSSRLAGDDLKKLKADEAEWLEWRVVGAHQKALGIADGGTLETYRKIRNEEALKLTRERTAVLQKQLEATSSK